MGNLAAAEQDGPVNHLPVLRDSRQRVLGGVCAGLARAWRVDPLLVRAGAVVVAVVTSGLGVFLYVALWLALPLDAVPRRRLRTPAGVLGAVALLALALLVGVPQSPGAAFGFALLGVLAFFWFAADRAGRRGSPPAPPAQQWQQPPTVAGRAAFARPGFAPVAPDWPAPPAPGGAARNAAPRRRLRWPGVLLGVAASWAALVVLAATGVPFDGVAYPAAALAVIGLALVVAARPVAAGGGRPRGLVASGLVAALATTSLLLPAQDGAPTPSSHLVISSSADLAHPIEMGVGTHTVDLSALTLDRDTKATITEEAGQLTVVLPRGVHVRSRYVVGLGQLRTPQRHASGVDIDVTENYPDAAGAPTLDLTIRTDLGDLEVRR